MVEVYVDADACPVREEIIKVTSRHGLKTYLVCDGGIRPHPSPLIHLVVVDQNPDAADKWIIRHIGPNDIAVTSDIPFAAKCIEVGATVVSPTGEMFTNKNIGPVLGTRDLMTNLRETGEVTGGPRPFSNQDRSRFSNSLEKTVQNKLRDVMKQN